MEERTAPYESCNRRRALRRIGPVCGLGQRRELTDFSGSPFAIRPPVL